MAGKDKVEEFYTRNEDGTFSWKKADGLFRPDSVVSQVLPSTDEILPEDALWIYINDEINFSELVFSSENKFLKCDVYKSIGGEWIDVTESFNSINGLWAQIDRDEVDNVATPITIPDSALYFDNEVFYLNTGEFFELRA